MEFLPAHPLLLQTLWLLLKAQLSQVVQLLLLRLLELLVPLLRLLHVPALA